MKLGICIPCHYGHVSYLECVLASIKRQTVLPDIVSINISEYNSETLPTYKSDKYDIIINTTKEQKNAAENRNLAAAAIIDKVDILSFIDADDFCAPRRNEFIKDIFKSQDVDLLLHGYFEWTTELQKKHVNEVISELNSNNPSQIVLTNHFNYRIIPILEFGQLYTAFPFHNGHASIRASVFKKQQYPEDDKLFGCGEDSHFNYLHYKLGSKVLATSLQLSLYALNTTGEDSPMIKILKEYSLKILNNQVSYKKDEAGNLYTSIL